MSQYYVNPGVAMSRPTSQWNGWGRPYAHNQSSLHGATSFTREDLIKARGAVHGIIDDRASSQGDYVSMSGNGSLGFLEAGIGIKEVGAAAAAYHGMQRYGLRGALVWGLAGYFFPLVAVGAAVVQGYAKKGGDGGIVDKIAAPVAGPKLGGSHTTSLRKAFASR